MKSDSKIMDPEDLQVCLARWRGSGRSIAFTNGCFDLLHVGHVTLLDKCRELGDKVVVGLNGDASVTRLKGTRRPIVREYDRARVLAALATIDAVTIFNEDTPLNLIRRIRPNVLVKGGDYTESSVVGAEDVRSWGGRVEIVPIVQGFSSTETIARVERALVLTR